jgi:hypothetical protein
MPAVHGKASGAMPSAACGKAADASVGAGTLGPALADDCQLQRALEFLRLLPVLAKS